MTVLINYTNGNSKVFMDVTSIEETSWFLLISLEGVANALPINNIRDIKVSL